MMTSKHVWLAGLCAGGLMMACGSNGTTTPPADVPVATDNPTTMDTGTGDGGMTGDVTGQDSTPTPDRVTTDVPVDRAMPTDPCTSARNLSTMMPGSDGSIHVTADTNDGAPVQIGELGLLSAMPPGCLGQTMGGDGAKGNVLVYQYTMRTASSLRVSTANAGTDDPAIDTVVAVLSTCSTTATPLACNDDVGAAGGTGHNLHSTAITSPLMMGQMVYIVVGNWGPSPDMAMPGPFELTVTEVNPGGRNGPCRVGGTTGACDMGLQCTAAMPTMAAPGTCVTEAAVGGTCTGTDIRCIAGSACINVAPAGMTAMGRCLANGAVGGLCRVGGMTGQCDMGLSCTVATSTMAAPGFCRTTVAAGAACDRTLVANACATGNTCAPAATVAEPTRAICTAIGTRGGNCRGESPRCDMGLECSTATAAGFCQEVLTTTGAACDLFGTASVCGAVMGMAQSCAANAMVSAGACAVNGTAAGTACRAAAPRCDTGLECSTATGAGFCRRSVAVDGACDARFNSTVCAMSSICAGAASTSVTGTCRAPIMEVEPNDTPAMGQGPLASPIFVNGSVEDGGQDCFRVMVPAGGSVFAEITNAADPMCDDNDSILTLYGPTGTELTTNDDAAGRGYCSTINPTADAAARGLAAGNYAVCVSGYMDAAVAGYSLRILAAAP